MTLNDVNRLATYNSEITRGIVHTEDYDKEMKTLQAEYNEGMKMNKNPCIWPPFFVTQD